MDPLDQRLTDAGAAWRRTQPEPADIDRMLIALRGRRSTSTQGRFMYAFLAGLLLVAALAVAPGVGGGLHLFQTTPPVVVPSTPPASSQEPASPDPSPRSQEPTPTATPSSAISDDAKATDVVNRYEAFLVAGRWRDAFDLLGRSSPTYEAGLDEFSSERAAYFQSVDGKYTVAEPTTVTDWASYGETVAGADTARAVLIEVDYPALAGNNAGYEQFVVAPDAEGTWRIWPVR